MNFYKNLSLLFVGCLIVGCSSTVSTSQEVKPSNQLNFIDLGKFDRELAVSLKDIDESVGVSFYEKVSPNQVPERLQKWISAVERSGGSVKIETPPNEPTARNPLSILSLLGSAYSAIKSQITPQPESFLSSTKGRNAVISLERGANGELLVEKIRFVK